MLAFAQPFLPASDATVKDDSDVAIYVDNSYSMQNLHAERDLSLLTTAADQAKSIIALFPASTSYRIASGERARLHTSVQATDATLFLDEVDFSAKRGQLISPPSVSPSHIFILSDFQRNASLAGMINRFDSTAQVHLVPVAAANLTNVAIDSVYLEDEFIRVSTDNALHVRVFNTGTEAVEDVPLKLFIEDKQVAALSMDLPPRQATEAVLNFRVNGTGLKRAYVQIEDYPVEFDNTYYFVLAPSPTVTITEITDAPEGSLKRLYANEPFFNFQQYSSSNIDYGRAASSNLVIVNGVKEFSSALATSVANMVKAGGSVVVIPAASAATAGFAALSQNLSIPASVTESPSANKTTLLAPDPNNPFFRGIFSDYDAKMQMPASVRQVVWSRASDDILKYRGGAPFLSRFDRGNGHLYLMAASLEEPYSTLANHALFVPIMYKLAISSYKQEQQLSYTLGDETIQVPAKGLNKREGVYELQKDSMAFIPEQQVRGNKLFFNVPADMDEAGFYTLRLKDSTYSVLAFNYSKEESYLDQYTPDELRVMVGSKGKNVHVYNYGDAFSVKGEFEKRYFGVKLWKYCLILCLFFLMAEIALIRLL
ncbi:MAG: hypothetical protein LPK14_03490 [Hymenobacteraceae bacterium]|nr:hypothetical protein [Hymenobacteraceae bacterium]